MDKQEIQEKIRYSSIAYARAHGIISKEEAEFLLDEYVKEFQSKVHSRSEKEKSHGTNNPPKQVWTKALR